MGPLIRISISVDRVVPGPTLMKAPVRPRARVAVLRQEAASGPGARTPIGLQALRVAPLGGAHVQSPGGRFLPPDPLPNRRSGVG